MESSNDSVPSGSGGSVSVSVIAINGNTIANLHLKPDVLVMDLKKEIARSTGVHIAAQELLLGSCILHDDEPLLVEVGAEAVSVTLVVQRLLFRHHSGCTVSNNGRLVTSACPSGVWSGAAIDTCVMDSGIHNWSIRVVDAQWTAGSVVTIGVAMQQVLPEVGSAWLQVYGIGNAGTFIKHCPLGDWREQKNRRSTAVDGLRPLLKGDLVRFRYNALRRELSIALDDGPLIVALTVPAGQTVVPAVAGYMNWVYELVEDPVKKDAEEAPEGASEETGAPAVAGNRSWVDKLVERIGQGAAEQ